MTFGGLSHVYVSGILRARGMTIAGGAYMTWIAAMSTTSRNFFPKMRPYGSALDVKMLASATGESLRTRLRTNKNKIHKIEAEHYNKSAKKQPSTSLDGLRQVIHLVLYCRVMLGRNVAYLYGLANGTRGKLIGVVYGPAGTGSLPEALIFEVPDYCGPAFYPDEPKWVPILPKFSRKSGSRMTRLQFPVVAGYALTVNKAQGLIIPEGVVINLAGGKRFRPAAKHGLPFVAWTRSESFAMMAFKNIPPWEYFIKVKS